MLNNLETIIAIVVGICTIVSFVTKMGRLFWSKLGEGLWSFLKLIWQLRIFVLGAIVLILGITLVYLVFYRNQTKSIEGKIYYEQSEEKPGLDPVPYVIVSISNQPQFTSEATDSAGWFVIKNVPADFQVTHLTAHRGGQDFPTEYRKTGDYAIIPRQPAQRDIREIVTPWKLSTKKCPIDNGEQVRKTRQYTLDTIVPAEGKHEAFLTVEVQGVSDAMILNAFVIWPSVQSGLYRNAMQGLDEKTAHRWLLTLPQTGLRIKLEICVGSNNSSDTLSPELLRTYYEFR